MKKILFLMIVVLCVSGVPVYSIDANMVLVAPDGGESWISGTTQSIQWQTNPETNIASVKIEYSTNDGNDWNDVNTVANTGSYEWLMSEVTSPNCLIRISDANDANVYDISDENFTIYVCRAGYDFVTKWGSYGEGDGQFRYPQCVATDSSGYVYVTDYWNHRVQKFDSDGSFITEWGSPGTGDGQFNDPVGITIDSSGYVYVADSKNDRIQKFDSDGSFITKWGSYGTGDGQFNTSFDIAIDDSSGYVYVTDRENHRVQKFEPNDSEPNIYDFVAKWGSYGSGDGQFDGWLCIATDSAGYVYVSESANKRVQKFTSDGTYIRQWGGSLVSCRT